MKNGKHITKDGTVEWYKDGTLHRENDLPAIEYSNGSKEWWVNDKLHRIGKPAIESPLGAKYWYFNGKLHRENGPAIEYGPHKEWYKHDKRHRLDGPALETMNDKENIIYEWWIEGIQYTEEEFNNYLEKKKLKKSLNEELNIRDSKLKVKI